MRVYGDNRILPVNSISKFIFNTLTLDKLKNSMKRFEDTGWDAGAKPDAAAKNDRKGEQVATNTSIDIDCVRIYQNAI